MKDLFRIFALLLVGLLTISMLAGCGGDDDSLEEIVPVANFVRADPPSGSETPIRGITLTFDAPPRDVTVSMGVATISGNTVTVMGPFTPGPFTLTVTWHGGTQTLTYTV